MLYRAFLIDTSDQVFAVRVLTSDTDEEALRLAKKIPTSCDAIEVWCHTRLLARVKPCGNTRHADKAGD